MPDATPDPDTGTIPHEGDTRDVVDDEMQVESAALANASVAHALNSTFSDTEVEAALNALGVKINAIIAVLKT